jgi:hypothetical protein
MYFVIRTLGNSQIVSAPYASLWCAERFAIACNRHRCADAIRIVNAQFVTIISY